MINLTLGVPLSFKGRMPFKTPGKRLDFDSRACIVLSDKHFTWFWLVAGVFAESPVWRRSANHLHTLIRQLILAKVLAVKSVMVILVRGIHSLNTICWHLFAAISQYFSSISMPIHRRPRSWQARAVVPLPRKGSRTMLGTLSALQEQVGRQPSWNHN